jgi:hypothetical protein
LRSKLGDCRDRRRRVTELYTGVGRLASATQGNAAEAWREFS